MAIIRLTPIIKDINGWAIFTLARALVPTNLPKNIPSIKAWIPVTLMAITDGIENFINNLEIFSVNKILLSI